MRRSDSAAGHNGTDAFTFEIRFDEAFKLIYETLRDHAFTVTGATVSKAQRLEEGSNLRWRITVEPDSNAVVTVVLPVTTDCANTGLSAQKTGGCSPVAWSSPSAARRRTGRRYRTLGSVLRCPKDCAMHTSAHNSEQGPASRARFRTASTSGKKTMGGTKRPARARTPGGG